MSLLKQQNFLARLYTDEKLRKSFIREPEKTGMENDLSDEEIQELAAVLPEELNFFAESLFWKRLRETEKFLPLTRKALGEEFSAYFRAFSQTYRPQSIKKHLEDSIVFCSFLREKKIEPVWAKDLIKLEQARLIFRSESKKFIFLKFDFDVRRILQELSGENYKMSPDFSKRKTYAVWLKIWTFNKHFIW